MLSSAPPPSPQNAPMASGHAHPEPVESSSEASPRDHRSRGNMQKGSRAPSKKKSVNSYDRSVVRGTSSIQPPATPSSDDQGQQRQTNLVEVTPKAHKYGFICKGGEISIKTGHGVEWQISEVDFRKSSKQFAAILDDENSKPIHLTKKDVEEGKTAIWLIEMIPNVHKPDDLGLRTLKLFDGKKGKGRLNWDDLENQGNANSPFNSNYDIFFRIICGKTRNLTDSIGSDLNDSRKDNEFITNVLSVLLIAEEHEATAAVAGFLEMNLLRMGKRLWYYISTNPKKWLGIAARLESPIMFKEAMCHAVGKIDAKQPIDRTFFENKGKLYENILQIMTRKVHELLALKKRVELELTSFWPMRMYHPPDEGYVPDRGVYTSDIYLYQCRSLVMQYIAGCYANGWHSPAADGGIRFYQTIRHGGNAYCTEDQLENFRARFAMSTRALEPFNQAMEIMKSEIKGCLDPIMDDKSQGFTNPDAKLGYLTCTLTTDDELPWKLPLDDF
ncbi:hypothetical protein GLAREA_00595 [Glarea lozoyensis ATCC 20868]|uniref:Uncharacterized protein n=2 Tax=Glarea lozoyensis TaxID=101852 RepID=S3CUW4_GLAL2|nr:uncharacterized protein GLAREA_00595 [Glarea lozoyensis ATCC 20868]EHL03457.1 hypothetical protein M7I_0398 [Glarea lozoyensis 74030]EPE29435.1 hypothetical protein GLAREA_00595 [Glarea lozoyensis ATCC 20868]